MSMFVILSEERSDESNDLYGLDRSPAENRWRY